MCTFIVHTTGKESELHLAVGALISLQAVPVLTDIGNQTEW